MRNIAVIVLLITLTIYSSVGYGQTHVIDSLKKELGHNLSDKEKSHLANLLAIQYMEQNNMLQSLQYAYISLEFATRAHDIETMSNAYLRIGNIYSFANIHSTALEYYLKSKNILKDTALADNLGSTYLFLGQTYNMLQQYDSARYYLDLSRKYMSRLKKKKWENILLILTGDLEKNTKNHTAALDDYNKSLSRFQEAKDTSGMIKTSFYIADLWEETENYQKEQEVLQSVMQLAKLAHKQHSTCKSMIKLAHCYLKTGNTDRVISLLTKGDSCASALDEIKLKKEVFLTWSEYYNQTHNPRKAYQNFNTYLVTKDSIQTQYFELVKNLLDIRYNTESKIKELDYLKRNNEIQDLHYQKNIFYKHIIVGLFFFFLLTLIILFLIYMIRRRSHSQLLETNKKLEKINTELKKRKEKQQFENQVRNKLFMILAHDLINPFNALLGFAGLLSEEMQEYSRKEIKRHSEFIYQSSKQLHFLLENLLQWARIQTGRFKFMPSYVEVNKILRDVTDSHKFMADKKKIMLSVDTADNMIVYADDTMITVILQNLIHNAIKYTGEGGSVKIKGTLKKDRVTISVCDTGCGISKEEIDKLFMLEHHFTRKGTSGEQGTGLGLIICKELLALHHSTLEVESNLDKGSCFSFSLMQKKDKI
ncbi:MAG: HAMP domain-containing histidine kinase [Bacteroidales bacterium]|nr:HAMP domain-containing histidine kinase [Bacteroidales bacterium]